jgi:hypothetical protein
MSIYLFHLVQTPATLAKLIVAPEDRSQTIEPIFKGVGGSLLGFWYGVGGADVHALGGSAATAAYRAPGEPA